MPDIASMPWTLAIAVVLAVAWVVLRETRWLRKNAGRNIRDVLDIALPILAIAVVAHGLWTHRTDELPPPQVPDAEQTPAPEQPPPATDELALANAATMTASQSDAALMAAALAAFQEGDALASARAALPAVGAQNAAPPAQDAPPPATVVAVPKNTQPDHTMRSAASQDVIAVLPAGTRGASTRRDGTGVVMSTDGSGVIISRQGPVVVASHYDNPNYRALRSCPDESCEIVANLSKFAPLTRTGKRHPQGIAQRAWVEVRSPGPYCKRYDQRSMTGACIEWQKSSVTGWTVDPTLLQAR